MRKIIYPAFMLALAMPILSSAQIVPASVASGPVDMSVASDEQLIYYTDHSDARVRVDAFTALVKRSHPACFSILLKHAADTEEVPIKDGCFTETVMAGDAMIDKYTALLKNVNGINEKDILDSALIYTVGVATLRSQSQMLLTTKPQDRFYKRIRSLAVDETDKNAAIALAKYRRAEDKSFFISQLNGDSKDLVATLHAISYFPDADFIPNLERIYKRSLKAKRPIYLTELCRTIAAYRNEQSLAFLQKVYQKHKRNAASPYLTAILTATSENAGPLYAELQTEVKKTITKGRAAELSKKMRKSRV